MPRKFIQTNNDSNTFGGGDIVIDVLKKRGIFEFIDSYLGKRSPRAEYSNSDAIITWFISQCRGARRFENIYDSQADLKKHPSFKKGMSPDTLSYICKKLAVPNEYYLKANISEKLSEKIKAGKAFDSHEVNSIVWFNKLLIDVALKLGRLKKGELYILDFDTTDIENKIAHSRKYYKGKGKRAYCPAVAMINKIPVYIENRNGDSNASFNLTQTIDNVLNLLEEKGIVISVIRIDAAGYSKDFTNYVIQRGLKYITRADSRTVQKEKEFIRNWTPTRIKKSTCEVGDNICHFGEEETRMIIKKEIKKVGEEPECWGIITNDFETPCEEIIKSYAQRGDSENLFRSLKEFGWNILPMRKFEHNTVFLYITALNYILFRFITKLFSSKINSVRENMKLKTFMDKFLRKSTSWAGNALKLSKQASGYAVLFGFT